MVRIITFLFTLLISTGAFCQDSLFADSTPKEIPRPAKIFESQRAINANTTELVGKGKMDFKVTHNFGDIGGDNGGVKNFFGLDNATDVRIGFEIGLGKKFDIILARSKGASQQFRLWEGGFKWTLLQQYEHDPKHPLALSFFFNTVIASNKAATIPNLDNSYRDFSDRVSNTYQLILAKKVGRISIQLNPTLVTRGYSISYDMKSLFALGGALRIPLTKNMNLILDYFHPFRSQASKDSFAMQSTPIHFYDPLGIGFEILTPGHTFHLNFTNATEILENRFIPRTVSSWGKGQFRWGFTISRTFTLWREK